MEEMSHVDSFEMASGPPARLANELKKSGSGAGAAEVRRGRVAAVAASIIREIILVCGVCDVVVGGVGADSS